MIGAALAISIFFLASARGKVVPGRLQAFGEILYDLVDKGLTGPMIGDRGRPFLPYVFALFSPDRRDEHLGHRPRISSPSPRSWPSPSAWRS